MNAFYNACENYHQKGFWHGEANENQFDCESNCGSSYENGCEIYCEIESGFQNDYGMGMNDDPILNRMPRILQRIGVEDGQARYTQHPYLLITFKTTAAYLK